MERFLVGGRFVWIAWDALDLLAPGIRIKTSLALTRARARKAMATSALLNLYARGFIFL